MLHKFEGVGEITWRSIARVLWWVTCKSQHVFNSGFYISGNDVGDFLTRMTNTGEMRHGRNIRFLLHPQNGVASVFAGRPARAVCDRYK